jgi:hypothetical protein
MNENLSWVFPVQGITESKSQAIYDTFKIKSRHVLRKELKFQLPGMMDYTVGEEFLLTLGSLPKRHADCIEKWFKIEPVKNTLNNILDELIYRVIF